MQNTYTEKQEALLDMVSEITDIDLRYILENDKPATIDDFIEQLEDSAREGAVIGYYKAIELLQEKDPSLTESLELAKEYGYTTDELNSELLATLLEHEHTIKTIHEYREELKQAFF